MEHEGKEESRALLCPCLSGPAVVLWKTVASQEVRGHSKSASLGRGRWEGAGGLNLNSATMWRRESQDGGGLQTSLPRHGEERGQSTACAPEASPTAGSGQMTNKLLGFSTA